MNYDLLSILSFLDKWQLYDHTRFWGEVISKLLDTKKAKIQVSKLFIKDINLQEALNYLTNSEDKLDGINQDVNNLSDIDLYGEYLKIKYYMKMCKIEEAENIILKICSKSLVDLANSCTISPSISPKSWKGTPVINENKKTLSSLFSTICANPTMLIKCIHTGELKIPGNSAGLYLWGNVLEELDMKVAALYCYAISLDWNPILWKSFERLISLSCQFPHELVRICCCLNNWGEKHQEYIGSSNDNLVLSTLYKNESDSWQIKSIQEGNILITVTGKSDSEELYVLDVSDFFYNYSDSTQKRQRQRNFAFNKWLESNNDVHSFGPSWPYNMDFESFKLSKTTSLNKQALGSLDLCFSGFHNSSEKFLTNDSTRNSLFFMLHILSKLTYQVEWYLCQSFLKMLEDIPCNISTIGYVIELQVKTLFESNQWQECLNVCSSINYETNYNLWINCLDLHSSCLWQLSKSIDLINLSNLVLKIVDKNTPQLWIVIGNCFSLHKEYENSIKCFKRAIQHNPRYVYAYTLIGHELSIIEKYDEAIQMYQKALKIDPRCHRAHWGIGYVWFKREEYNQAKTHFSIALKVVPNNSTLIHYLGLCYLTTHDFLSAYNTFQKGILKDQRNPWLKYHAGIVLLELERYEDALTMLTAAHRLASNEPNIHLYLGKTYSQLSRKDKSLRHLNIAFDLTKDINEKQIILNMMKELESGPIGEGKFRCSETDRVIRDSKNGVSSLSGNKTLSSFRNHHYFPIRNDPPNPFIQHQSHQEQNLPHSAPSPIVSGAHSFLLTLMPGNS
ncbi:TPR repeat protein [Cryptosporidium ryanae]|uniref:TPR repeat protein n=1 Tax=Cryptosporidium ryanae TaxID=515981 RepID=UPI00351A28E5|nr:TPR repeat protein [Cryptosporidium ryanae]